MGPVWAVVVTYNRKALLEECLQALHAQERAVDHVLVIDNASTDGTPDMVRERFPWAQLRTLPDNQGGAGGFHEGLKAAHDSGAEWIWLMDDDTIPTPTALARLLEARERVPEDAQAPLVLSSKVVWSDGRIHPMNAPGYERNRVDRLVAGVERGLMPLRCATFVSLMVHRDAIDRHGLPLKHYFIWSDDIEYTARILRREDAGYLVPDSIVLHKTKEPYTAVSTTGDRFYFHIRNHVFMLRGSSWDWREKLTLVYVMLTSSLSYMQFNKWSPEKAKTIGRGLRDGVKRVPLLP
jgi:rhamnopyranosyl-N-acetylglucosaminyl-diphospho-decaprenol beta-1,3/1,4-galactofuranosyltransferase